MLQSIQQEPCFQKTEKIIQMVSGIAPSVDSADIN